VINLHCYDPSEQSFKLKDKIIGIDWGKNEDRAIQTTVKRKNGKLIVVEMKELDKS